MHIQDGSAGWTDALLAMPDGALCKSVNDASKLTDARAKWLAAGRDGRRLFTCFRHADIHNTNTLLDWEATKAHWRAQFFKAIDRTYLEQHADSVTLFEGANEFTDDAMANGLKPAEMLLAYRNTAAAVAVWNEELRGRTVTAPDGGAGVIPADCRLVIGNVPVGNDIPKSFYELAVAHDCVLGYHPYTLWHHSQRGNGDWRFHSGRWAENEERYGLRPVYAWTEAGPYLNADHGWRHGDVCAGDVGLLAAAVEAWLLDTVQTPAYRAGRILGPGAFFTTGGGHQWRWYELETQQLMALAEVARRVWVQVDQGDIEVNLDDVLAIRADAQHILDVTEKYVAPPPWWQKATPYTFKAAPVNPLRLYRPDRVTVGANLNYTGWGITVSAVDTAGWLKVVDPAGDANDLFLRAGDVTPL